MEDIRISKTMIDTKLWNVEKYIMQKHGVDSARRALAPLDWYISTGRASAEFLKALCGAKSFMIGRLLTKGGSYDEVLKRVKAYIGYQELI